MDDTQARGRLNAYKNSEVGASFSGRDLTSINPNRHHFDRCDFSSSDLRQATLDSRSFRFCSFVGANLRGASLRGADFAGCDFTNADLRDCDLTHASFGYVNTGDGTGLTTFTGARLDGAILSNVTADRVIDWPVN